MLLRRPLALAAAFLLAALPLQAAAPKATPRPPASAKVHPILLNPVANPGGPLARAWSAQVPLVAGAPDAHAAAARLAAAAAAGPLERLAAATLAKAAMNPDAGGRLLAARPELSEAVGLKAAAGRFAGEPALLELAALADAEPAAAWLFDGGAEAPHDLDGLSYGWRGMTLGAERAPKLGQGEFGLVNAHSRAEGAAVKAVAIDPYTLIETGATEEESADRDERTSRTLAAIGAGPAYLWRGQPQGYQVSIRERVYGRPLSELLADGTYAAAEHALVLDLLRLLARAKVTVSDLRPPNVMIGRTLLDPRRRALIVDGDSVLALPADWDGERAFRELLAQPVVVRGGRDKYMGKFAVTRPLESLLQRGLERSRPMTRVQRLVWTLRGLAGSW